MAPGIDQQALIRSLSNVDPMAAYQMLQPKPRKLTTVAPGASMVDENDPTRAVFTAPDKADKVNPNQPFFIGKDGSFTPNVAYQQYARDLALASRSPGSTATVVMPTQEKEESKAVGKYFGEQYGEIQKAGLAASQTMNRLNGMGQLLEGVNTGKLAPIGMEVAAYAQSLGMNIDPKLGNRQALEAVSREMALQLRSPAGGAGMPGALSDQDRKFLESMTPGLSKTPEGNRMIVEARKKLAQRDQEVAKLARDYRSKKGTLDEGFYEELSRFSSANPLFPQSSRSPQQTMQDADEIIRRGR